MIEALILAVSLYGATDMRLESGEEQRVREIAQQLRCAVCQNESVADSGSTLAKNMRDVIREQVASGESPEAIKAYFVSKYGDYILMEPRKEGMNLLLWVFPFLALVLGGVVIGLHLRKGPQTAFADPKSDDELIRALGGTPKIQGDSK